VPDSYRYRKLDPAGVLPRIGRCSRLSPWAVAGVPGGVLPRPESKTCPGSQRCAYVWRA